MLFAALAAPLYLYLATSSRLRAAQILFQNVTAQEATGDMHIMVTSYDEGLVSLPAWARGLSHLPSAVPGFLCRRGFPMRPLRMPTAMLFRATSASSSRHVFSSTEEQRIRSPLHDCSPTHT